MLSGQGLQVADPPHEPIACPHLGLEDDSTTRFYSSSESNCCWRLKNPAEVALDHQSEFCLCNNFTSCPVYVVGRPATGVKPLRATRVLASPPAVAINWRGIVVILEVLLAIALGAAFIFGWVWSPETPVRTPYSLPTHAPRATVPSIAELPTLIPDLPLAAFEVSGTPASGTAIGLTATLSPNVTSTLASSEQSATPALTPAPGLDQPIGPFNLIAHRVEAGENLVSIAARFDTTRELLVKVNGLNDQRLLEPGQVLAVPQGQTDLGQLPRLVAFLTVQDTALDVIIGQLSGDMAMVRQLNALGEGNVVPAGRWLFIPQP
jgi:hypothetical protein